MHNSSPNPIRINPGFSTWLAAYLLAAHLLAVIVVLLLERGIYLSFSLIAIILFSLIYHCRRDLLHQALNSVVSVEWSNDRGWLVSLKSGSNLEAELCPTSFVSQWIVVLHFRTNNSDRYRVAVSGDAIDSDQLRRLRVLLKMHNHFGV